MEHLNQNLTLPEECLEKSNQIKYASDEVQKIDNLFLSKYLLNKNDIAHFCQYDQTNQSYKVGSYILDRIIGKGNFSVVKLAIHIPTQIQVAVKVMHKSKMTAETLEKTYREVQIMKRLRHSNIVQLYQVIESSDWIFIIMEYVPLGELFEYLSQVGRLTENDARGKFRQILDAVEYCHKMNIVHRDLKAENLLIDKSFNIKLADFGFGSFYNKSYLLSTWCGSPPYAAPELFKGEPYVGPKADIWSLGVVLYAMVCGTLPFDEPYSIVKLRQQVVSGLVRFPYFLSYECELLIRMILTRNPIKRPSILTIRNHKWMQLSSDESPISLDTSPVNDSSLWQSPAQSRTSRRSKTMCDDSGFDEPRDFMRSCSEKASLSMSADYVDCEVNDNVIHAMERCGYKRSAIIEDLCQNRYGPLTATYLLLCEKQRSLHRTKPQSLISFIPVPDTSLHAPPVNPQPVPSDQIDSTSVPQGCLIKDTEVSLRQMELDDIPLDFRPRCGSLYDRVITKKCNQPGIIPISPDVKDLSMQSSVVANNNNVAVVDLVKSYDYKIDDDCRCCKMVRSPVNKPHCCYDNGQRVNTRVHTTSMTYGRDIDSVKPSILMAAQPSLPVNQPMTAPSKQFANQMSVPSNGPVNNQVIVLDPRATYQTSSSYCMPQKAILIHGFNANSLPVKSTVIGNFSYDIKPKMIKFVETPVPLSKCREAVIPAATVVNPMTRINRYSNLVSNNDYQASRDINTVIAPANHNRYYPLVANNIDYRCIQGNQVPMEHFCLSPTTNPRVAQPPCNFVSPVAINFIRLS